MGEKYKRDLKRLKILVELRERGLSYRAIGEAFGISRQRVHQILKESYGGSDVYRGSNENDELFPIPGGDIYACERRGEALSSEGCGGCWEDDDPSRSMPDT